MEPKSAIRLRRYETSIYKMIITKTEQPVDNRADRHSSSPVTLPKLMRAKAARVLAIDPGTSLTGVAVLEGRDLLYYGVKELRRHRPEAHLMKATQSMVTDLIELYAPNVLAYEKSVYVQQVSSTLLRAVEDELQRTAKTAGLKVIGYSPAYVRQSLCGNPWSTKHMVAARLVERFPELERYRIGQSVRSERYWLNMFDALAVAVVAVRQLDGVADGRDGFAISRAA